MDQKLLLRQQMREAMEDECRANTMSIGISKERAASNANYAYRLDTQFQARLVTALPNCDVRGVSVHPSIFRHGVAASQTSKWATSGSRRTRGSSAHRIWLC